ncbi:MAG TPA: ankyrin repeat domain-containing protein, partial [bacterium]
MVTPEPKIRTIIINILKKMEADNLPINAQLFLETWRGNLHRVQELIQLGADVNTINDSGVTILMIAAAKGHKDIMKILLDKGANINITSDGGNTAFCYAFKDFSREETSIKGEDGITFFTSENENILECVNLLLDYGADVNQQ